MSDKIRILVIDDEQVVCSSCERVLIEEGYELETVLNGNKGIKRLKAEEFDIVLTDLKMPGTSGMEVLEYIKENLPDIQVIVMTGYSTIKNAVESIKKGAFDYLPKPFSPEELLSVVQGASIQIMQTHKKIHSRETAPYKYGFDNIVGNSKKMCGLYQKIKKVAKTDTTVLITGESGTGKELISRAIHNHSLRKDKQFIVVDCSTLAESLLESELFGHVKGSFTGAVSAKHGIFEIADKGTLFLDEISNIPMATQSKLLRVLEEHRFRPVGAEKEKEVDIRLIAATNRDLKTMIEKGKFREDLYYRLNVFSIVVPPLKKRPEDIPLLACHFLRQICQTLDKRIQGFSTGAMETLISFDWPGNVRELKNVVERLVVMAETGLLSNDQIDVIEKEGFNKKKVVPLTNTDLKQARRNATKEAVEEIEKIFILEALSRNDWNITKAAEATGMQRTNLQTLIKKNNITLKKHTNTIDDN